MVQKLLNPIVAGAITLVFIFGIAGHLMYGSSQVSKWHYLIQHYHMPQYLPAWMLIGHGQSEKGVTIDSDYTGVWRTYFKEGTLSNKTEYANGDFHGKRIVWYSNGHKNSEILYDQNKRVSYTNWNKEGVLEEKWIEGIQTYSTEWYYTNWKIPKKIKKTSEYFQKNNHWETIGWYENGNKMYRKYYVNGTLDGKVEHWYSGGVISSHGFYKMGIKIDTHMSWLENGEKLSETHYENNSPVHAKNWYKNGKQKSSVAYLNGKVHGKFESWHFNGNRKILCFYKKGIPNGKTILWYKNGIMQIIGNYNNGKFTVLNQWDVNGTKK